MRSSFPKVAIGIGLALPLLLNGQMVLRETYTSPSTDVTIPDGSGTGLSDILTVQQSAIGSIGSVSVSLTIRGEFNGDLYAYLQHGDRLAILINRPGKSTGNPYGYDDSGLTITLTDRAAYDLHVYREVATPEPGRALAGTWQPDGRNVDPVGVDAASPRTAMLGSLTGLDPNGNWTLFLADLHAGGPSQLGSWQLTLTSVPESRATGLVLGCGLALLAAGRRGYLGTRVHVLTAHLGLFGAHVGRGAHRPDRAGEPDEQADWPR